jgi:2-polyprenyl-3-methyl-5-hydroxy-6-metoxy-1,4-benzoquinol methylase
MPHSPTEAATSVPATRGFSLNRVLRKLFPSTSRLTFNPLFRFVVNATDVIPRLIYSEFSSLPPNHLRIRVGVGNRLFNNQSQYLQHARDFWLFAFSEGIVNMNSNILDVGVGCGRWAHWLRDYNFRGRQFAGEYVGIDIDNEAIEWCRQNFDSNRFRFHHSTDSSTSYNQQGSTQTSYRVPEPDGTFDLIFSNSLLTHVLEAQLKNYIRESYRLLKPNGMMMHSHFNMDHLPATFGTRHTFAHSIGNARVESLTQPEAAVAYFTDLLFSISREAGFRECGVIHMPGGWQHQPVLICRK